MNISEFESLLDQYGWDMSSWPEPLRQEGNRFVAQNDEAAELIRHLHSLEDDFAADPLPMGRHKAIDDIFGAIEAAENTTRSGTDENDDPDDHAARGRHPHAHSADEDPAQDHLAQLFERAGAENMRRHIPAGSPRQDTRRPHAAQAPAYHHAASDSPAPEHPPFPQTGDARRTFMIPAVAMLLCVIFGFVFGVAFTAQQGISSSAEADELPVARIVDRHLYDLAMPENETTGSQTGPNAAEEKPNDQ